MHVVSLICQKGGAGKTTLALHLAIEGHLRGLRVLVVDLDPQQSATRIMERRGEDPPDAMSAHASMLDRALATAAEQDYHLVVLDTAPAADGASLIAARASDRVVIPVRATVMDLDAMKSSLAICELARKPAVFVLNAISPQGGEADQAALVIGSGGGEVAPVRIGARKILAQAFNSGRGAQEAQPGGLAAIEIAALYDALDLPMPVQARSRSRATAGAA